jgi:hypothetical protein
MLFNPRGATGPATLFTFAATVALNLGACGASHSPPTKPHAQRAPVASQDEPKPSTEEPAPSGNTTASTSPEENQAPASPGRKSPLDWLEEKRTYGFGDDGFSQIAQGDTFAPIEAIDVWYEAIAGSAKHEPWGEDEHFQGTTTGRGTLVTSRKHSVEVVLDADRVKIGSRVFRDAAVRSLFSSLSRLLGDLETAFGAGGVKGTRYSNSAYRDAAILEFCYPPLVVTVSALSNGRSNPERLYVLDLIKRSDSLLWQE